MSVTRRSFITTSSVGAAAVCVGTNVGGYTRIEAQAGPGEDKLTGVSKWDLDTPALCVDLDALERNIATMQTRARAMNVASRPHGKTHKCPAIAKLQLASGSIGICAAKLSEAEVFSANGIGPILMTTSNVSPAKIRRAMALRKSNPQFVQAVDYAPNARDLNDAAREAGIVADVVVDVAIGARSGVPAGDQAIALAQLVVAANGAETAAQALKRVQAGDTVVLAGGVHRGPLVIDRPVTLIGEPGTVLDGGGKGDAIRITAAGVTLSGFAVRRSGMDLGSDDAAIRVKANDVVIAGMVITESLHGIYVQDAAFVTLRDNRITGDAAIREADRGNA